jgi:xanthine dehydrogenase YagS FAD-binding subunit
MTGFTYERPDTLEGALAAIAEGAVPVGGGTDLLVWIEEGLPAPERMVDVRAWPGATSIEVAADGSTRIGAAARIADVAAHAGIRERFPALAQACASVGSPALRNMGTLGGNLGQRMRCWYLRRNVPCFKNHGTGCPAVGGEHQYHGIVAGGTCRAVHPSDPAVALSALAARVEVTATDGSRRSLDIDALYEGAAAEPGRELRIAANELITAVELPAGAADGVQHWEKVIQRGAWDFALVSCAGARHADGSVRIAFGGLALGPVRAALSVEEDVASGELDAESIDALAERAMYDMEPLPGTAYKVVIAKGALKRAMNRLQV